MKKLILLLAVIIAAVSGGFAQDGRITDIQWTLVSANGRSVQNAAAYFEIAADGSKFTGNTGCNRMFGTVSIKGDRLTFSGVGTTKMMCKLPAGSVPENTFLRLLDRTTRYAVDGNNLTLYDRGRKTLLRFTRQVRYAPVDPPAKLAKLEDRKWMLESIKDRKTFAPIKDVFVSFDEKRKSAGGNGGCNVFGGNYTATRSTIKISKMILTMRACTDDGKMDTEREFVDGLRDANRYEMRDDRLFLYNGKELLLTLRGENKS